jgi:trans-aconitate 2-methyltransferase
VRRRRQHRERERRRPRARRRRSGREAVRDPEATAALLASAGFVEVRCWLEDRPTPLPPDDLEPYLRAICLGGVLETMAAPERDDFVRNVAERLPEPTIDYVRLNISARRG